MWWSVFMILAKSRGKLRSLKNYLGLALSVRATISDSKSDFHKEFPYVIPPIYRKLADELLVELHIHYRSIATSRGFGWILNHTVQGQNVLPPSLAEIACTCRPHRRLTLRTPSSSSRQRFARSRKMRNVAVLSCRVKKSTTKQRWVIDQVPRILCLQNGSHLVLESRSSPI